MNIHRALQATLALLAALGGVALGFGQRSVLLPLVTVAAAGGGFLLTDVRRRINIGGLTANAAALVAAVIAAIDYSQQERGQELLSVANLLTYLQIIPLFQEKTVRVAWQLLSLSLLQLVVASALSDSVTFGVLVLAYAVVASLALVLLFLFRETLQHAAAADVSDLLVNKPHRRPPVGAARYSLARSPITRGDCAGFQTAAEGRRGIRRVVFGITATAVAVMLVGFVTIPRLGRRGGAFGADAGPIAVTGFSDNVTLSDNSRMIFQDDSTVMRVSFSEAATGKAFRPEGDLWFRGAVADTYHDRRWHCSSPRANDGQNANAGDSPIAAIRQELRMERTEFDALCCIYPAFQPPSLAKDDRIEFRPLRRAQPQRATTEPYLLHTTGFQNRVQHPLVACAVKPAVTALLPRDEFSKDRISSTESTDAGTIRGVAQTMAGDAATVYERCRKLESSLRDSGEYTYTLARPAGATNADPTVDFLTSNKRGHCEFFASGLALMLRSLGIPARLVNGFKSSEWNPVGGYVQVRQLHAHSWVEAYLSEEDLQQVSSGLKVPGQSYTNGAWLRLDATPAMDGSDLAAGGIGVWSTVKGLFDYADLLWRNYVVGYSQQRQERWLWGPLFVTAYETAAAVFGENSRIALWLFDFGFEETPTEATEKAVGDGEWFVGVVRLIPLVVGAALVCGIVFGAVWFVGSVWSRRRGARPHRAVAPAVEFYADFERLLATYGILRGPQQTQLEFAAAAAQRWPAAAPLAHVDQLARRIVGLYYRVRFGGRELSTAEERQVADDLARLRGSTT